jgi:hypothetical protein
MSSAHSLPAGIRPIRPPAKARRVTNNRCHLANVETRMTKQARMTKRGNDEFRIGCVRHSYFVIVSTFVVVGAREGVRSTFRQ